MSGIPKLYSSLHINYSLLSIFVLIPLIYSHTFSKLGEIFIIENGIGNFESVKVSLFFLLLFIATIESLFKDRGFLSQKSIQIGAILLLFIIGEFVFFGPESVFGIGEKQHGSLFFASLIWFGYLLSEIKKQYYFHFIRAIIVTSIIVSCVAMGENIFHYNLFSGAVEELSRSWGSNRATSTLGNPNYVAGYLLMSLPFSGYLQGVWKKFSTRFLILFGIISTGSVIGVTLVCFYFLFLLLEKISKKHSKKILFIFLCIGIVLIVYLFAGTEKWLSLSSRFILMKETVLTGFDSLSSSLIGNGPNGIILYYDGIRTPEVMNYFPNNMTIDSSHNIFIDLFFKFGILGILGIAAFIQLNWSNQSDKQKWSFLLGSLFFSLNVPILSAYLLFLFALIAKNSEG